jgi:hypothetical protein
MNQKVASMYYMNALGISKDDMNVLMSAKWCVFRPLNLYLLGF